MVRFVQDLLLKDLLYYRGRLSTDACLLSTFSDKGTINGALFWKKKH